MGGGLGTGMAWLARCAGALVPHHGKNLVEHLLDRVLAQQLRRQLDELLVLVVGEFLEALRRELALLLREREYHVEGVVRRRVLALDDHHGRVKFAHGLLDGLVRTAFEHDLQLGGRRDVVDREEGRVELVLCRASALALLHGALLLLLLLLLMRRELRHARHKGGDVCRGEYEQKGDEQKGGSKRHAPAVVSR